MKAARVLALALFLPPALAAVAAFLGVVLVEFRKPNRDSVAVSAAAFGASATVTSLTLSLARLLDGPDRTRLTKLAVHGLASCLLFVFSTLARYGFVAVSASGGAGGPGAFGRWVSLPVLAVLSTVPFVLGMVTALTAYLELSAFVLGHQRPEWAVRALAWYAGAPRPRPGGEEVAAHVPEEAVPQEQGEGQPEEHHRDQP